MSVSARPQLVELAGDRHKADQLEFHLALLGGTLPCGGSPRSTPFLRRMAAVHSPASAFHRELPLGFSSANNHLIGEAAGVYVGA